MSALGAEVHGVAEKMSEAQSHISLVQARVAALESHCPRAGRRSADFDLDWHGDRQPMAAVVSAGEADDAEERLRHGLRELGRWQADVTEAAQEVLSEPRVLQRESAACAWGGQRRTNVTASLGAEWLGESAVDKAPASGYAAARCSGGAGERSRYHHSRPETTIRQLEEDLAALRKECLSLAGSGQQQLPTHWGKDAPHVPKRWAPSPPAFAATAECDQLQAQMSQGRLSQGTGPVSLEHERVSVGRLYDELRRLEEEACQRRRRAGDLTPRDSLAPFAAGAAGAADAAGAAGAAARRPPPRRAASTGTLRAPAPRRR